jgi:eukaryotic-like serine/threonine-protein kinase
LVTTILGRYRIDREVGRGAMGVVYLAYDEKLDRPVALKELVIQQHLNDQLRREMEDRFDREARAAGRLSHPNVVSVYDVLSVDGRSFIVMEYLEGTTLDQVLAAGPLEPQQAAAVAVQVLAAVEHAHEGGVIHRDLKPENVFILPNGAVKVTDFGIAHLAETSSRFTHAGTIIGTVGYMSPEQLRGEPVDERSDVFAVGVLLYEMLTGFNPFGTDTQTAVMYRIAYEEPPVLKSLRPGVPRYLEAVIRKAVHKAPEYRYQSAGEMARDILERRAPKVHKGVPLAPPPVTAPAFAATPVPDVARAGAAATVIALPDESAAEALAEAGNTAEEAPAAVAAELDAPAALVTDQPEGPGPPPSSPPAPDAADNEEGGHGRRHLTILVAVIAVAIAAVAAVALFLLPNGGDVQTSTDPAIVLSQGQDLDVVLSQLETVSADYRRTVAQTKSAASANDTDLKAWDREWKRRQDDYKKAKSDVKKYNEWARNNSTLTTTKQVPYQAWDWALERYVTKYKTVTVQGDTIPLHSEPDPPTQPAKVKAGFAKQVSQLKDEAAAVAEASRALGALSLLNDFAGTKERATKALETLSAKIGAAQQALDGVVSSGPHGDVVDQAKLAQVDAQDISSANIAARKSLMAVLAAYDITARQLKTGVLASPSPGVSGSPSPAAN